MIGQFRWIQYEVEMKSLYDQEKYLWEKKKELLAQYFQVRSNSLPICFLTESTLQSQLSAQLEKLIAEDSWIRALGIQEYQRRKKSIIDKELELEIEYDNAAEQLQQLRQKIQQKKIARETDNTLPKKPSQIESASHPRVDALLEQIPLNVAVQ